MARKLKIMENEKHPLDDLKMTKSLKNVKNEKCTLKETRIHECNLLGACDSYTHTLYLLCSYPGLADCTAAITMAFLMAPGLGIKGTTYYDI